MIQNIVNTKLSACQAEVKSKLTKEDEKKIYKELKRFAEYEDFKGLYKMVMPTI